MNWGCSPVAPCLELAATLFFVLWSYLGGLRLKDAWGCLRYMAGFKIVRHWFLKEARFNLQWKQASLPFMNPSQSLRLLIEKNAVHNFVWERHHSHPKKSQANPTEHWHRSGADKPHVLKQRMQVFTRDACHVAGQGPAKHDRPWWRHSAFSQALLILDEDLWRPRYMFIWVCLKIVYPQTQWLMIIIPIKWL